MLYSLRVWFFIIFCSKSVTPTYFAVSAHFFMLSSIVVLFASVLWNLDFHFTWFGVESVVLARGLIFFFFKLRFAASRSHQRISQFQHIYFHSLHFFEGWSLKYATCILFWQWLCSLINQSPHLVAGLCVLQNKKSSLFERKHSLWL